MTPPRPSEDAVLRARIARGLRERWAVLSVLGLLSAPLVVALVWLHFVRPAPIFDLAVFEMRVRDVGTAHTPLVGLVGRLSTWPEMGSHLGPLGFYVLAPLYWLLGASYRALQASAAVLAMLGSLTALLVARRRAGDPGVLMTGVVLALFGLAFGLLVRTAPWNPYLPVPWVPPFLLAVVSVLSGDVRLLPLVAAIGSLCAQTHISYLALCGGLGLAAFAFAGWRSVRGPDAAARREAGRICGLTAAVTILLWLPPVIEELTRERGNLTIVLEHFLRPPEAFLGARKGVELVLQRLDLWFLVRRAFETPGVLALPMGGDPSALRGALGLILWVGVAGRALFRRERALLPLHATVAISIGLSTVAASRIIGFPFVYVAFFAWLVAALVVLSLLAALATGPRASALARSHPRVATGTALAFMAVCALRSSSTPEDAGGRDLSSARQLAALLPGTVWHLRRHAEAHPGVRYLMTWEDALHGGGQGIGLTVELERRGFDVAIPPAYAPMVGQHRMLDPARATFRVHLVNAAWIGEAQRVPGAVLLSHTDLRTKAEKADFEKARRELVMGLLRIGRGDLIPRVGFSLPGVNVPELGIEKLSIARMTEIGVPAAVFLLPPR